MPCLKPHQSTPVIERVDALIHDLHARISRMASYYARCSGHDADDLLQDAWLCVLEAHRQYDPSAGAMRPWLVRRARWRMLDVIKHQRFRKGPTVDNSNELAAEWRGDNDGVEEREFIATLSPLQQRILLCLMNGWTWRDTGAKLGFTSANVAYHVREIRRRYELWNLDHHTIPSLAESAG
jgi:RNA polymerase sigma factor (sigma-70 family)